MALNCAADPKRTAIVFASGPHVSVTVCPSRLLQDEPEADAVLAWWMESSTFEAFSGAPCGPPEWPLPGGYLMQPARLVQAVSVLRSEWGHVPRERSKPEPEEKPEPGRRRKGGVR